MKKERQEIGKMPCPVCGNLCPVNRGGRGRLSMVCKWQESGCGSQLLTLTADSSMILAKKVAKTAEPKPEQEKNPKAASKPAAEPKADDLPVDPKPVRAPSPAEAWGLL